VNTGSGGRSTFSLRFAAAGAQRQTKTPRLRLAPPCEPLPPPPPPRAKPSPPSPLLRFNAAFPPAATLPRIYRLRLSHRPPTTRTIRCGRSLLPWLALREALRQRRGRLRTSICSSSASGRAPGPTTLAHSWSGFRLGNAMHACFWSGSGRCDSFLSG
jgi:hypothetical protein